MCLMSSAFLALIWWVVPAAALIGALGYVLWVTKFQGRFEQETSRSVGQFQRFQESLAEQQRIGSLPNATLAHDITGEKIDEADTKN